MKTQPSPPAQPTAGSAVGWLAGQLAGWLAGQLAGGLRRLVWLERDGGDGFQDGASALDLGLVQCLVAHGLRGRAVGRDDGGRASADGAAGAGGEVEQLERLHLHRRHLEIDNNNNTGNIAEQRDKKWE